MTGPLSVAVDLGLPTPPYEQIRSQIAAHLSAGALRPGDRLPTVRALAADLGVAVGTVSRAYRELEQEGAVTSRRRAGTVVTGNAPGTADRAPVAPAPSAPAPVAGTPTPPPTVPGTRRAAPAAGTHRPGPGDAGGRSGVAGLVAAADALAAAAVAAGAEDREVLTLVSGALLLARRTAASSPPR